MLKLPVMAVTKEVYGFVFREFINLLRVAWAPVIFVIVLTAFSHQQGTGPTESAVGALLIIAASLINILAFVRWIRFVVLGEDETSRSIFAVGRYEGQVLLAYLIVFGLFFAVVMFFGLIALGLHLASTQSSGQPTSASLGSLAILALLALFCVFYVSIRMSLAFPSSAVSGQMQLKQTIAATKGNVTRLFSVMILTAFPLIAILAFVIFLLSGDAEVQTAMSPLQAWIASAFGMVIQIFGAVALGISYIKLVDLPAARHQSLTS